jgi:hypothetical protein
MFALAGLLCSTAGLAQPSPGERVSISGPNTGILAKLSGTIGASSSKPGDLVKGEVVDPVALRGAEIEGRVGRADHDIIEFSFHTLRLGRQSWAIQSKLMSVTSARGTEGQDDLGQRVRIEGAAGAGIIAYGETTRLDDGAELRLTIWEK